ncbi:PDDEXK nuclease domain-containing protein [Leptolyngbya sp. GGD]|uniref:PDDEXK nuclease domain-containing protein n=1 Tax=Leptolyngbya sp. GGD TaxID=2997907 RepID=UPI00227B8D87|nr:PDDEXK nuclease domain-containing protein [Leptolyngbya sp. GGD]MCY6494326.1 PDDEXK nuclease domain-containing protein [Leptolyngbya sp. GGD]
MAKSSSLVPEGYPQLLNDLKERIRTAQVRAAVAVNRELVLLYWQIGRMILDRQAQAGWGAKVIDQLSKDLRREFPEIKGFSSRNLKYMRTFAETYPDSSIVQEVLAQITWYHNLALLEKLKTTEDRLWYAQQTIANGWSRNILVIQIETRLRDRQGKAMTNFERTLPKPQSDLANSLLKSPYSFDFLSLGREAQERDLENALVAHIRDFLLELGVGFAFVGSQYHLQVGNEDYYVDLVFYHLKLRCFVIIDLKMIEFTPEMSGKMNFYLAVVDDLLRHPDDQPTIGLILCKSKNQTIVEYALRSINRPIGVSTHEIWNSLPEQFKQSLPSIEQLELEMDAAIEDDLT